MVATSPSRLKKHREAQARKHRNMSTNSHSLPAQAHTLRLILGDQLSPRHSWFAQVNPSVVYVLMEVRQETDYVLHHAQKILAIFAAMREFARQLRIAGHRVHYVAIDDNSNHQSIPNNLSALAQIYGVRRIEWQQPDEWRLDTMLRTWGTNQPLPWVVVGSEHFLTEREELSTLMGKQRPWLMERFYRHMRRRWRLLLDDDGYPEGGKWNFDHDNRKRWPGTPAEPADWRQEHDHSTLWRTIENAGVRSFGQPQANTLRWPLNRDEALACLDAFIRTALPYFGDYEDALAAQAPRLFHSLLSFALNVKMLHPLEVVQRAEAAWRAGLAPLAAVEGFIRQIIGWREYMRGIYWAHMPSYESLNGFGHRRALPHWFWSGQTQMRCLRLAITQSLENAYAHHIQRLMVIGNFALLAGLEPQALHRWYLGIYIDAFEWVELPNTLGMSQCADGGLIATKPYISSAAYLQRMGDYCQGCAYDPKQKTGSRACPFNSLYWDFFDRNASTLQNNSRLALVYRQLEKMPDTQRAALRLHASALREQLDRL